MKLCNYTEAVISCKDKCDIQLSFPKSIDISCRLLDESQRSVDGCVDYSLHENQANIQCSLPSVGTFTFLVYGKERNNKEHSSFTSIVTYRIDNIAHTSGGVLDKRHQGLWGPTARFYEMKLQYCLPFTTTLLHKPTDGPFISICYFSDNPDLQLKGDIFTPQTTSQAKIDNYTFTNRNANGERHILISVPNKEKHILRIYARCNNNKNFELVSCYQVQRMELLFDAMPFPKMTIRWLKNNCTLISPLTGLLKQNETVSFHVVIEEALDVIVILPQNKIVKLKSKEDNVWKGIFNVGFYKGKAQLYAKTTQDNCYYKYLQFLI